MLLIYVILSNLVNIIVKDLTTVPPVTLLFYRSLIMLGVSMPWAVAAGKPPFPPDMDRKEQGLLVVRGMVGFANILASYYSLRYLNIGDQKMVASSRPVWVILFSRLFLKESCGVVDVVLMLMMMSGLVLVIKPPFLFGREAGSDYDNPALWSALAVLITTALSSNTTIILRKMRKQHVASLTAANQILFLIQTFSLIWLGGFELSSPVVGDKVMILVMSLVVITYSVLNMLALKILEANISSMVTSCTDLVVAMLVQMLYYKVVPDMLGGMGGALVGLVLLVTCVRKVWGEVQGEEGDHKVEWWHLHIQTVSNKLKTFLL